MLRWIGAIDAKYQLAWLDGYRTP